jgi:hypothetical protein
MGLSERWIAGKGSIGAAPHSKISGVNSSSIEWDALKANIDQFFAAVFGKDRQAIIKMLQKIVPDYRPAKKMAELPDLYYR